MPSTNELAAYYRLNPATAAKGIGMLTDDGVLEKRRGTGMLVAAGARALLLGERRKQFAERYVEPLVAEAGRLGIGADELAATIRESSYRWEVRRYDAGDLGGRLSRNYRGQLAVDRVTFDLEPGSITGLLGRNSAGKTTTVRILATLSRADAGQARVAGFDVGRDRRQVRRHISLTGQFAALDAAQTGEENLRMIGWLAGLPRAAACRRTAELLEQFDLATVAGRRVGTYSGGMRRRLDLAASLTGRPAVIFLDEPTTGLDPQSRLTTWRAIAGLAAEGVTVFLTTQYLDEADRLADQIAVLTGGLLVAAGTAAELKRRVAPQRLDLTCPTSAAFEQVRSALTHRVVHLDPAARTVGVATDGSAAQVRALLDQGDPDRDLVASFAVRGATLDDVFFTLTAPAREATHI